MKILHTGQEHRHLFMYLTWWEGAYLQSILSKCEVTKSNQPGNLNEVWTAGEASPLASPIVHAVNEHFTVQTRNAHAHRATSHGGTAQDSLPNHKGVSHVEKTSMPSSVQDHQTCTADTSSNKHSHNCCWIAGQKKAHPDQWPPHIYSQWEGAVMNAYSGYSSNSIQWIVIFTSYTTSILAGQSWLHRSPRQSLTKPSSQHAYVSAFLIKTQSRHCPEHGCTLRCSALLQRCLTVLLETSGNSSAGAEKVLTTYKVLYLLIFSSKEKISHDYSLVSIYGKKSCNTSQAEWKSKEHFGVVVWFGFFSSLGCWVFLIRITTFSQKASSERQAFKYQISTSRN